MMHLLNLFQKSAALFRKIGKIISYIPVLYRDEDWDYEYILILLQHKLERARYELKYRSVAPSVGQEKLIKRMDVIIESIKRYIADEYSENSGLYGALEEQFKKATRTQGPDGSVRISFAGATKAERARMAFLRKKCYEQQSEDLDRIFTGLRKYIRNMWD